MQFLSPCSPAHFSLTLYIGECLPLETLGFALGTSFASGLNVYATVAAAGLMQRLGLVQLPDSLQVLSHPIVLGVAVTLFLVEFIADKIPYVDSAWDAVHTFIRPPAAAVLSYSAFGNVPEECKIGAALLAGSVALTSHGAKASARAAANTSPEPVSNWALSILRGWTGGVSGVDGGRAPAADGGNRAGAGGHRGAADPKAVEIRARLADRFRRDQQG